MTTNTTMTMRAAVQHRYGPPSVLVIFDNAEAKQPPKVSLALARRDVPSVTPAHETPKGKKDR